MSGNDDVAETEEIEPAADQPEREPPDDPLIHESEDDVVFAYRDQGVDASEHWMEALIPEHILERGYMGRYQGPIVGAFRALEHDIRRVCTPETANKWVGDADDPDDGGIIGEILVRQLRGQMSIEGLNINNAHETGRAVLGSGGGEGMSIQIGNVVDDEEDDE